MQICKIGVSLSGNQKQNNMKTFKISFQDIDGNELWMSITEQVTIEDAHKYAQLIYATSMVNDLAQYEISEF